MGKIKNLIEQPVTDVQKEVTYKGETYTLIGRPDATLVMNLTGGRNAGSNASLASHYQKIAGGGEFDEHSVIGVKMVAATLCHEDDPDERYDESEIAKLAVRDAGLFLKLMKAASDVLGISPEEVKSGDTPSAVIQVAAGESESGD